MVIEIELVDPNKPGGEPLAILKFEDNTPFDEIQRRTQEFMEQQKMGIFATTEAERAPGKFIREVGEAAVEQAPILGAAVGTGLGALAGGVGAIPGAAIGAGTGQAIKRGIQEFRGKEEPISQPQRFREIGEQALVAGVAGELGGQLVVRGGQAIAAPFVKKVTEAGRRTIETFKRIKVDEARKQLKPGQRLTGGVLQKAEREAFGLLRPAQLTDSRVLDIADNVGRSSLFGGGPIARQELQRTQFLNEVINDTVDKFGQSLSPEELGLLVTASINRNKTVQGAAAQRLYSKVDGLIEEAGGGAVVDMRPVKQWANGQLKRLAKVPRGIKTSQRVEMLEDVAKSDDFVTFAEAQDLRSEALTVEATVAGAKKDKFVFLANQYADQVDKTIETSGRDLFPEALSVWRKANQLWRMRQEEFNSRFIRRIIRIGEDSPDKLSKAIFKPKSTVPIRKIRNIVSPAVWKRAQASLITDLVDDAIDPISGNVDPKKIFNALNKYGKETLKEIFPEGEHIALRKIAEAGELLNRPQAEGFGKVLVALTQGGAVTSGGAAIITGEPRLLLAAGGLLSTPAAIGRILVSKRATRWLTTGMLERPGTREFARLQTRLLIFLRAEAEKQRAERTGIEKPTKVQQPAGQQVPTIRQQEKQGVQ